MADKFVPTSIAEIEERINNPKQEEPKNSKCRFKGFASRKFYELEEKLNEFADAEGIIYRDIKYSTTDRKDGILYSAILIYET